MAEGMNIYNRCRYLSSLVRRCAVTCMPVCSSSGLDRLLSLKPVLQQTHAQAQGPKGTCITWVHPGRAPFPHIEISPWLLQQVCSVDASVQPPSYGIELGDHFRETEANRLAPRGSGPASAPPSSAAKQGDLLSHLPSDQQSSSGGKLRHSRSNPTPPGPRRMQFRF